MLSAVAAVRAIFTVYVCVVVPSSAVTTTATPVLAPAVSATADEFVPDDDAAPPTVIVHRGKLKNLLTGAAVFGQVASMIACVSR